MDEETDFRKVELMAEAYMHNRQNNISSLV